MAASPNGSGLLQSKTPSRSRDERGFPWCHPSQANPVAKQKTVGDDDGWMGGPASLFWVRRTRYTSFDYTLCPDNGGNSGADYSLFGAQTSSYGSEAHSAPACGRGFHLSPCSLDHRCGAYSSSSRPLDFQMSDRTLGIVLQEILLQTRKLSNHAFAGLSQWVESSLAVFRFAEGPSIRPGLLTEASAPGARSETSPNKRKSRDLGQQEEGWRPRPTSGRERRYRDNLAGLSGAYG